MAEPTADDWRRVWRTIAHEVEDVLGVTWKSVEREGKVSQKTLYKMRDDGTPLVSKPKRRSLCDALGWTSDSIDRILRGEPPQRLPADDLLLHLGQVGHHLKGETPGDDLDRRLRFGLEHLAPELLTYIRTLEADDDRSGRSRTGSEESRFPDQRPALHSDLVALAREVEALAARVARLDGGGSKQVAG